MLLRPQKNLLDILLRLMLVGTAKRCGTDKLHLPFQLFRQFGSEIGLAASRRSVEKDAIGQVQAILHGFLRMLQRPKNPLSEVLLEFIHAGYLCKSHLFLFAERLYIHIDT